MRAIHLYCDLISGSVLDGLQAELAASGVDVGARAELPEEMVPEEEPAEEAAVEPEPEPSEAEASPAAE
jgi:small subunit ribosomal protein S2